MNERIMYLRGEYLPESEARVSVFDRGMLWGDGVYDVARTIRHKPFLLREHLDRLYRSLRMVRIDPGLAKDEMEAVTLGVLERNLPLLAENDDFRLVQVVTRGGTDGFGLRGFDGADPTVAVFCASIDFKEMARQYRTGVRLATASIRQRSPQDLEAKLKCTSKMSHTLAEIEALRAGPDHMVLLQDSQGHVTEGASSSFFIVKDGKLITSDPTNILGGITREGLLKLAAELRIPSQERAITLYDVYNAEEAMILGTSFFLLPVREVNGLRIGGEPPGPMFKRIMEAWSEAIGHDIVGQAISHLGVAEKAGGRTGSRLHAWTASGSSRKDAW